MRLGNSATALKQITLYLKVKFRSTWLAQQEEHATPDLWAVSLGPPLGIEITKI